MSAQTPLPPDDPRRIAWRAYQESEEYANTRRWALLENSVDGSLWAAFIAGFAAASPPTPDSAPPNPLEYCRDCGGSYTKHREGCPVVGSPLQSGAGSVGELKFFGLRVVTDPSVPEGEIRMPESRTLFKASTVASTPRIAALRPVEEPSVEQLLDAVEDRHEEDGACPACTHPSCERRRQRSAEAITARASLESAFSVLREEVGRLRAMLDGTRNIYTTLSESYETRLKALTAELSRLRGQTND